jgi:nucleotide-binding universal stress UspA family protein
MIMTGKLIALVDGSAYSKSVCEHAAWVVKRTGITVELLHMLGRREGSASADLSGSLALGARSALLDQLSSLDQQRSKLAVQRGRAILEDARSLLEAAGVRDVVEQLRHGDLVDELEERTSGAEMILIGKRGEGADFAKGHLGSDLERVVRSTDKPLLVASRSYRPIEKVLVAYDGSPSALRAVDYVAHSPLYQGLQVTVVMAGPNTDKAKQDLADVGSLLGHAGCVVETELLPGQPEDTLPKLVEDAGFDHLVMGRSGHSRLRALFVGSTSLEMIRTCKVPILLVR